MPASVLDPRRPWSERVCEFACLSFALWTVVCNLVIGRRGSLQDLIFAEAAVFLGVSLLALAAWVAARRGVRPGQPARTPPPPSGPVDSTSPREARKGWMGALKIAAAVLTSLSLVAYPVFSRIELFWWLAILILSMGLLAIALSPSKPEVPVPHRSLRWETLLWTLALASVAFNLLVHRPDTDDSLYLNIAARAADLPDMPLMAADQMHGIEGLSFHSHVYLPNSIEPLWGMMSYLSGINAQLWFHAVHAGLGALLIVLAYAALFRILLPDRWLPAVAVILVLLLGAGGPQNHWYGNLSFVRLWQGKCTFLHVFLPLTFAYSMRFALQPSAYGWVLLAAAQTAAMGMSSSAIWVEPLAAGIGLLCGTLGRGFRGWLRLIVGCSSSFYVLGVGLRLKALMRSSSEKILRDDFKLRDYSLTVGFQEVLDTTGQALDWAWKNVMGEGLLLYLCLAAMLISWALTRHSLARRFAVLSPLLTLVFVMNPYMEKFVMANLVGPVYYRTTWLLPVPVLATIGFLAGLDVDPRRVPRRMMLFLMVVALAGYAVRVSEFATYDRRNGVFYGPPQVKIFPEINQSIRQAMDLLPEGAHIIAPTALNFWFPTYHRPLYPVTVNKWYTYVRVDELGRDEIDWRIALTEYVSGESRAEGFPDRFREGLGHFGIQGVIVDQRGEWRHEIASVLETNRFQAIEPLEFRGEARYQLWTRASDDADVLSAAPWKVLALRP